MCVCSLSWVRSATLHLKIFDFICSQGSLNFTVLCLSINKGELKEVPVDTTKMFSAVGKQKFGRVSVVVVVGVCRWVLAGLLV